MFKVIGKDKYYKMNSLDILITCRTRKEWYDLLEEFTDWQYEYHKKK